ncbi:MAG: response regulator transcription factor [Cytophagales bacterium]|nr:response regulator transcription factor [Cytophagales bacterium]
MNKLKIIVADDHHLVRSGIVKILEEETSIEVISEVNNGKEAIDKCKILKPDILLLDLDMPIMNGLEAVPLLKESVPNLKIGILTMHKEKFLVEKLMKMGVDGYLYKSSDPQDLIYGVQKIAAGKRYYDSEVTENIVLESTFSEPNKESALLLALLSDREKEILRMIAEGHSSAEIGEKLFISARTAETHRSNIIKKIQVKNVAGLIRFAIKSGLVS